MSNFSAGVQISLTGMLIVMTSLGALALLIKMMEKVLYQNDNDKNEADDSLTPIDEKQHQDDEGQKGLTASKVAAISGAIAAYLNQEDKDYLVTSIKPINDSWKLSGRQKLLLNQINAGKNRKIRSTKLRRQNRLNNYNQGGVLKNA